MSTRKTPRSIWSTPKRSAMTRESWSGVRTPRSTSTSPVRRPLARDSAIAASTDSRLAYPRSTTMSPMKRDERPRLVGSVRPGRRWSGAGADSASDTLLVSAAPGLSSTPTGAAYRQPEALLQRLPSRVESLVDERVGRGVLGARDRAHLPALEGAQRLHRLAVQRAHVGVLDLVEPVDLLGHEL